MRLIMWVLITLLMVGCSESPPPAAPDGRVEASMPPPDGDGDGITDTADACPATAGGAKVDAKGCETDDDGDGVVDSADTCPGTAAGDTVDAAGCNVRLTEAKEFTLRVDFASGSANIIGDVVNGVLVDVVALMKKYPETHVRIEGHTDSKGSAASNQRISAQRAEAVAQVMGERWGLIAIGSRPKAWAKPSRSLRTTPPKAATRIAA